MSDEALSDAAVTASVAKMERNAAIRKRSRAAPKSDIAFVDRKGKRLSREEWVVLAENKNYCDIRVFEGKDIKITATWIGAIVGASKSFPGQWEPFNLWVEDRVGEDSDENPWKVNDLMSETFRTEELLLRDYEAIVLKYTPSYRGLDGKVVEVGNADFLLAAGDAPAETQDNFGTW